MALTPHTKFTSECAVGTHDLVYDLKVIYFFFHQNGVKGKLKSSFQKNIISKLDTFSFFLKNLQGSNILINSCCLHNVAVLIPLLSDTSYCHCWNF